MKALITGLMWAVLLVTPALADSKWPEYDGTGSRLIPLPGDKPPEVTSDPIFEAVKRKSASTNPVDLFDLGTIYAQGSGGEAVDLKRAYDLFEQAAAKGDRGAQSILCVSYLIGENRPADFKTAMTHCAKLRESDPARMFANAYDYELGLSGPKDEAAALGFHFEAAKVGNGESMNRLGVMLRDVPGKAEVVRAWFRQGAMQGSASAMYHLAQMAEAGQGGPEDKAMAGWLYTNAARRGHVAAKTWLDAQPTPPILPRSQLTDAKRTLLTETITKGETRKTRPFSFSKASNMYPTAAVMTDTEGSATIHCYISATHRIDICLPVSEFPVGFNFSGIQQAVLRGELSAAAVDVCDRPTAQTVYPVTFRWMMH